MNFSEHFRDLVFSERMDNIVWRWRFEYSMESAFEALIEWEKVVESLNLSASFATVSSEFQISISSTLWLSLIER